MGKIQSCKTCKHNIEQQFYTSGLIKRCIECNNDYSSYEYCPDLDDTLNKVKI